MSHKSPRIAQLIESCQGHALPAHYLGFFKCFNQELFYEAHDVLEELWLADRQSPNYAFYKGLIQLAGAFVHMQKHSEKYPRLHPSAALFKLARTNLQKYPAIHEHFDVSHALLLVETWLTRLENGRYVENPLKTYPPPKLALVGGIT